MLIVYFFFVAEKAVRSLTFLLTFPSEEDIMFGMELYSLPVNCSKKGHGAVNKIWNSS